MAKERKTINVSLQSKKYLEPINKILNEWEAEELNLSTQICENLLLVQRLKNSITFGNVLAVYELIERMMKVYDIKDKSQLEQIFSEIISIDHAKLGQMVTKLNPEISVKPQAEAAMTQTENPTVQIQTTKVEEKPIATPVEVVKPMDAENSDPEIPIDFLFNS